MRRRRSLWLIAAIVLFAICGWLLLRDETPTEPAKEVEIPHYMRPKERERMQRRRTLPLLPPPKLTAAQPEAPPRPRDPVLAALASGHGKVAIVIEANAIRYSPIGQLLIDCLASLPGGNPIEQAKDQLGIDPLQDLDRVAITDDGVVLSGNFKNEKWDQLLQQHSDEFSTDTQPYGDKGTIYTLSPQGQLGDGGTPPSETFASWNNELVFLGKTPGAAQQAIDRIEGRADAEPAISEDQTYGEIYGTLSPQALADMIPPEQSDLRNQLLDVAQKVQLHVDAMNDVGVSLTLQGNDVDKVTDLGKSAAGALSLARLYAKSQGDDDLASLLDYAKVDPNGSSFDLDLALPMSWFEKELAWCRDPKLRAQHFGLDAGSP